MVRKRRSLGVQVGKIPPTKVIRNELLSRTVFKAKVQVALLRKTAKVVTLLVLVTTKDGVAVVRSSA
jgi:hypothetical protein